MQNIEPYYNWRHLYTAEEDLRSPFFGNVYSEFEYSQTLYNFYIHPQWDQFGSKTLFLKMLFVEYDMHFAIIELMGEWNDAIENDIMTLRRNITDIMYDQGIYKFIFIAENVLNFHSSDDCYYEDWIDQLSDEHGWVCLLNFPEQSQYDFIRTKLNRYIELRDVPQWRTYKPELLFQLVESEHLRQLD